MAVFDTHKAYEALATKTDIGTVKTDLRELELRMRLHLYGVAIVIIGVLAALELLPR